MNGLEGLPREGDGKEEKIERLAHRCWMGDSSIEAYEYHAFPYTVVVGVRPGGNDNSDWPFVFGVKDICSMGQSELTTTDMNGEIDSFMLDACGPIEHSGIMEALEFALHVLRGNDPYEFGETPRTRR